MTYDDVESLSKTTGETAASDSIRNGNKVNSQFFVWLVAAALAIAGGSAAGMLLTTSSSHSALDGKANASAFATDDDERTNFFLKFYNEHGEPTYDEQHPLLVGIPNAYDLDDPEAPWNVGNNATKEHPLIYIKETEEEDETALFFKADLDDPLVQERQQDLEFDLMMTSLLEEEQREEEESHRSHYHVQNRHRRELQQAQQVVTYPDLHSPLPCNDESTMDCSTTPLSSLALTAGQPLTIPCGTCVYIDTTDDSTLVFPDGIRIEGKLYSPPTASVTLRTTFVLVLGIWEMDEPNSGQVKVSLFGEDDVSFVQHPQQPNPNACNATSGGCNIGKKVIAVAGGKLNIKGYDSACEAWEPLLNVSSSTTITTGGIGTIPPSVLSPTPEHCPANLFSNPTFDSATTTDPWVGDRNPIRLDPYCVPGNCYLEAYHRNSWDRGVYQSVDPTCITNGQSWKITAKVRMYNNDGSGVACSPNNGNIFCPMVRVKMVKGGSVSMMNGYDPTMNWDANGGWVDYQFRFDTNPNMEGCDEFTVIFEGGPSWTILGVDDLKMEPDYQSVSYDFCSANIVKNYNGNEGSPTNLLVPWGGYGNPAGIFAPGVGGGSDKALMAYNRNNWPRGIYQALDTTCLGGNEQWKLEFNVRLFDNSTASDPDTSTWTGVDCTPNINNVYCPFVRFQSNPNGNWAWDHVYDPNMVWDANGWSTFSVVMTTPSGWDTITVLNMVIAGGPANTILVVDDVTFAHYTPEVTTAGPVDQLHVSPATAACWNRPGAEILLTTPTRSFEDEQVRTIASVDTVNGIITLTSGLDVIPSDPLHPIEVALLNRNIVFEADSDAGDALIGGHLIVYYTPNVPQHLEGVEIRNFGQQGFAGRYPVHFHICEDSTGSVVRKNVVCYVMHGTNNVLLENNVAYDAFGHCYVLEDGSENGNTFKYNLGAGVKAATNLIPSPFRVETDCEPGVFWIAHASNDFLGNVATGSFSSCWFFETHNTIRGEAFYQDQSLVPKNTNLGLFKDNVAHGCGHFGFTTYPPQWEPEAVAVIENFRVYRTARLGLFLHNTRNLHFVGGYIADIGQVGVSVLRGDDITFDGTKIVGLNEGVPPSLGCINEVDQVGIVLHPEKTHETNAGTIRGTTLKNVEFSRWSSSAFNCGTTNQKFPVVVGIAQTYGGTFSAPHVLDNVSVDDTSMVNMDACAAKNTLGIDDVVIEVANDAMGVSPNGNDGFLVSPEHNAFAGPSCTALSGGCLEFCDNVCLRMVRFVVNAAADNYVMVVTDGTTTQYVYRSTNMYYAYDARDDAIYNVALPGGTYTVHFEDSTGNTVWPSYVLPVYEAPPTTCSNYVTEGSITVVKPPQDSRCDNLIRNGSFDAHLYWWQELVAGIYWNPTDGVGGSGALKATEARTDAHIIQYLDTTCLEEGAEYDLSVSYRVVDENNVNVNTCTGGSCPSVVISFEDFNPATGQLATIPPTVIGGSTVLPYQGGTAFNTITGSWTVAPQHVAADKVRFSIGGGEGKFIVDNVSLTKRSRLDICGVNQLVNANLETGSVTPWKIWNGTPLSTVCNTTNNNDCYLQASGRNGWVDGVYQNVDPSCAAVPGETWRAKAKVRLVDETTGQGIVCTPGSTDCPFLRLYTRKNGVHDFVNYYGLASPWDPNGWNDLDVSFALDADNAGQGLSTFRPVFVGGPAGSVLMIDDAEFYLVG